MLEALKDLYISYPFMPLSEPPAWFKHVKDIRLVVTLPASNIISKYKKSAHGPVEYVEGNWYAIRAYLKSIDMVAQTASIDVYCEQVQEDPIPFTVNMYDWTAGVPSEQSYMLIDNDLAPTAIPTAGYELQLDTLLFMQVAPALYVDSIKCDRQLVFGMGHNVSVSKVGDGVLFYGATGTGLGTVSSDDSVDILGETVSLASIKPRDHVGDATIVSKTPTSVTYTYRNETSIVEDTAYTSKKYMPEAKDRLPIEKQGFGITNINGITDSVWLKGTFPVNVKYQDEIKDGKLRVEYTEL